MIKAVIFDCFGVVLTVFGARNESMIEFVGSLRPDYKVGMLTNVSGRYELDKRFKDQELNQLFDVVLASGDEGFEKPDHFVYEKIAERLGVKPEECLFIDDIPRFCDAAREVGMTAIQCIDPEICILEIQQLLGVIDTEVKTD